MLMYQLIGGIDNQLIDWRAAVRYVIVRDARAERLRVDEQNFDFESSPLPYDVSHLQHCNAILPQHCATYVVTTRERSEGGR